MSERIFVLGIDPSKRKLDGALVTAQGERLICRANGP